MTDCLDENAIAEFLAGDMIAPDVRRCEDHIDRCSTCRIVLAELAHTSAIHQRTLLDIDPWEATLPGDDHAPVNAVLAERFRLLRVAGRGGMGVVYEAEDIVLGVKVALKMIPHAFASSSTYLHHLHSEIRVGRRIAHRNVCRIYDLGTSGGIHFIAMEYVDGQTLADLLARGRIPQPRGLEILRQVVEALEAAHEVGVVHRDLKPSNIMLDDAGQVKVMDFGLAKDLAAESSVRDGPIGTPAYWAPEQSRGEAASVESDVYAFGLIAYEVLADRYPTETERQSLSGLRARARAVVRRCVRSSPRERFRTATELRKAIDELGASRLRRGSTWTTVAAVAAVSAIGLGALVASGVGRTARAERAASWAMPRSVEPDAPDQSPLDESLAPVPPPIAGPAPAAIPPAHPSSPPTEVAARRARRSSAVHRKPAAAAVTLAAPIRVPEPTTGPRPVADVGALLDRGASVASIESRRKQRGLSVSDVAGYARAIGRARRALAGSAVADADLAIAEMERLVDGTAVNATFVRAKLERIKRMADDDSLPEATAQRVKQLFERVHRAYFDEDYMAANGYLAAIGNLVAQERRR